MRNATTAALGLALVLVSLGAAVVGRTQPRGCSERDSEAAFKKVSKFGLLLNRSHPEANWSLFQRLYRKYGHCDDGAPAEGFSDSAARLVAHRWMDTLEFFAARSDEDPFLSFVLDHIDGTDGADDLLHARKNAVEACPDDRREFCARIEKACMRALEPLLPDGL